jgi:hypothetical protein
MRRQKANTGAGTQRRRAIASGAARLMAEGGITDFGAAKRKAARQIGANEDDALPSNAEVETELRAYQAIFQGDEHNDRLFEMRQSGLEAMKFLETFQPCMTGAVLDGTAGRFAAIELDLFADSSKDVEIFLLSNGISYSSTDIKQQNPLSPEICLHIEWNDDQVDLRVYPVAARRSAGRETRAKADAVAAMLAEHSLGRPE